MKWILIATILISLLLLGCKTEVEVTYPNITTIYSSSSSSSSIIPEYVPTETNFTNSYGEVVSTVDWSNDKINIIDCGSTAQGLEIADEARHRTYTERKIIGSLTITNISSQYINGCEDIIRELHDLQIVYVNATSEPTELHEALKWVPSKKVIYNG